MKEEEEEEEKEAAELAKINTCIIWLLIFVTSSYIISLSLQMHAVLPDFQTSFCSKSRVSVTSNHSCMWNKENEDECRETVDKRLSSFVSQITLKSEDLVNQSKQIKRRRQPSQQNDIPDILNESTCERKLVTPAKRAKRSCFIVRAKEMQAFFGLLGDC